jgi:hypothetical protein
MMKQRAVNKTKKLIPGLMGLALLFPIICCGGLSITPLRTELTGSPGTTLSGSLSVYDNNTMPVSYEVTMEGSVGDQNDIRSWLQVATNRVDLKPKEKIELNYTIQIPSTAKGELLGRVGFLAVPSGEGSSPVAIRTKISVPIHVLIEGTVEERAAIKALYWSNEHPQNLDLAVENTGNVLLRLSGECRLIDTKTGEVVASLPVNQAHTPLYTGVTRIFPMKLLSPLKPGTYEAHARVVLSGSKQVLEHQQMFSVPEAAVVSLKP